MSPPPPGLHDDPHDPTRPEWHIVGTRGEEFQIEPDLPRKPWPWWLGAAIACAVILWLLRVL